MGDPREQCGMKWLDVLELVLYHVVPEKEHQDQKGDERWCAAEPGQVLATASEMAVPTGQAKVWK